MKSICFFIAGILLSVFAIGQDSYLQRIKPIPENPSKEKFDAYLASLDSLQTEVEVIIEKYQAENEAAVKNIDQAKMVQSYQNYSQNVYPDNAMAIIQIQQDV